MGLTKHLLFILCFSGCILYAQTNFEPRYIITLEGDTIRGEIDSREPAVTEVLCAFRKNEGSELRKYSPNEISAFRVDDGKYLVSREVNGQRVFLEYLIKGKFNVYFLRQGVAKYYYFDKEDVPLTLIPYEEGTKYDEENVKYFFQTTKHIGVLKYNMIDAPNLHSRIAQIKRPEHRKLIKLAHDYHYEVCDDETCIVFEKQEKRLRITFDVFGGAARYNKRYVDQTDFRSELGVNVYLWIPQSFQRFHVKTGLILQTTLEEDLGVLYKIPAQLQYLPVSDKKLTPRIAIGYNILPQGFMTNPDLKVLFCINGGANYRVSKSLSVFTNISSEHIPLIFTAQAGGEGSFRQAGYSVNAGIYVNFYDW